jgi:hypothetical protein
MKEHKRPQRSCKITDGEIFYCAAITRVPLMPNGIIAFNPIYENT